MWTLSELFTGFSTICALVALVFSAIAWRIVRTERKVPRRVLDELQLDTAEQALAISSLKSRLTRLNARVGMREARAKLAESEEAGGAVDENPARRDNESELEWKRRTRLLIAQGKLGHGR